MTIQLIARPAGGWHSPWPQVFELSNVFNSESWVLVGGLMVQAHVMNAELPLVRVTDDVDVITRFEAQTSNYANAAASLIRLGYQFDDSTEWAYRFRRDRDVVDLMAPDHSRPSPRYQQRNVFLVSGGAQALERVVRFSFDGGQDALSIPVPSLQSALILKSAAASVDTRDRDRHLLDAISLLACVTSVDEILTGRKGSDTKRLNSLLHRLDQRQILFAQAHPDISQLAAITRSELLEALR